MAGFANMGEVGRADDEGRTHFCSFRKAPAQSVSAGEWQDLSLAAGNPPAQYYAASPLVASVLDGQRGIFHGDDKTPATKWLYEFGITATSANAVGQYRLVDFLLYYPFIDLDDTDPQTTTNTTTLPRYTTGAGVRVMGTLVAPTTGSGSFTFDYINQDGAARTSPVIPLSSTAGAIGAVVSSFSNNLLAPGPLLPLTGGDTGVRSITSVTVLVAGGGLMALTLVKPLFDFVIREANVAHEFVMWGPGGARPVQIVDGAFLGLIGRPTNSLSGVFLTGHCRFVWN